jgi:DNA invertase Pin-like site-specific DNA recombinase
MDSRGIQAQKRAIREAARVRSWRILEIFVEDPDAGSRLDRPQLRRALELLSRGEAHGMVVSDLDRLTPSLFDLVALLRWFQEAGCALVLLTPELDTSTAEWAEAFGRVAEWERTMIATRSREGLAARRRRGEPISRPAVADRPELLDRIKQMHHAGLRLQDIADKLNADGVPTLRGGAKWRPSSIQTAIGYRRPRRETKHAMLPPPRP